MTSRGMLVQGPRSKGDGTGPARTLKPHRLSGSGGCAAMVTSTWRCAADPVELAVDPDCNRAGQV